MQRVNSKSPVFMFFHKMLLLPIHCHDNRVRFRNQLGHDRASLGHFLNQMGHDMIHLGHVLVRLGHPKTPQNPIFNPKMRKAKVFFLFLRVTLRMRPKGS